MTYSTRLFALLCLLASGVTAVGYVCPEWAAAVGCDWRATALGLRTQEQEGRRLAWLEERSAVIKARIEAKRAVVLRLMDGDLPLVEAAAWFGRLNDNPPEHRDNFRDRFPGGGDGEKLCRQVITWAHVEWQTAASPSRADEERHRLERELETLLGRERNVVLPNLD